MLRIALALSLLIMPIGCGQSTIPPSGEGADKDKVIGGGSATPVAFNTGGLPTITFEVPDMHCEVMCVPKVRETLAAQPGVKDVQVDLDTKTATVAIEIEAFSSEAAITALETAEFANSVVMPVPADS